MECGFTRPTSSLRMEDRTDLIQTVSLHKAILASLAELSDFKEGLNTLGVVDALKQHGNLLRPFFCNDAKVELTSGWLYPYLYCLPSLPLVLLDSIRTMFTIVRYSEKGSNEREREESSYMYFIDYLDDCEKGSY